MEIEGGNDLDQLAGLNEQLDDTIKIKKPRFKLETELVESSLGLSALYKTFCVNQDNLKLKGKSHEISDFNRIMNAVKGWENAMAPKLQYDLFVTRCQ